MRKTNRIAWQTEQFDLLINNAGTGVYTPFAETTEAEFDYMMDIHVRRLTHIYDCYLLRLGSLNLE